MRTSFGLQANPSWLARLSSGLLAGQGDSAKVQRTAQVGHGALRAIRLGSIPCKRTSGKVLSGEAEH